MIVDVNKEVSRPNTISSTPAFIASNNNGSLKLDLMNQSNQLFNPPDNGGPDITQGSGTR